VVRADSGTRPFSDAFVASAAFATALQIPRDDPHLVVSRLFHGAPLTFALSALAAGTPLLVMERWDAAAAVDLLADGAASTIMVPTMFRQMLALPEATRARLPVPTLHTVIHGGEPCPVGLKRRMIDWLGPIFVEYFGVSEGGMTLASTEDWLARPGTVGRIHTAAGVVILDDDGHEVPAGTEGAVYFRSGGASFSYKGDPDKTESAHRGDAFTAGDIGYVDADGYLFLSGRRADVIVSAGVNVYPAEIETELEVVPGGARSRSRWSSWPMGSHPTRSWPASRPGPPSTWPGTSARRTTSWRPPSPATTPASCCGARCATACGATSRPSPRGPDPGRGAGPGAGGPGVRQARAGSGVGGRGDDRHNPPS
jgi:acyl-CoA synthetase (AMP-forming)/AMP-acid ligase II